ALLHLQDLCVFYQDMVVCGVDEPSVRLVLKAKIDGLYPSLAEFCNSWLEIRIRTSDNCFCEFAIAGHCHHIHGHTYINTLFAKGKDFCPSSKGNIRVGPAHGARGNKGETLFWERGF